MRRMMLTSAALLTLGVAGGVRTGGTPGAQAQSGGAAIEEHGRPGQPGPSHEPVEHKASGPNDGRQGHAGPAPASTNPDAGAGAPSSDSVGMPPDETGADTTTPENWNTRQGPPPGTGSQKESGSPRGSGSDKPVPLPEPVSPDRP